MDTTIPHHPGILLGQYVNMKTMQPVYTLTGEDASPTVSKVIKKTAQFSFVTTLQDVCEILSIPPEYALKVKAGIEGFHNELVETCLKNLGEKDAFRIIFKTSFIEQKQHLSRNDVPAVPNILEEQVKNSCITESSSAEVAAALESSIRGGDPSLPERQTGNPTVTHWVKAIEVGTELVVIMTVSCKDSEKLNEQKQKLSTCLKLKFGDLDTTNMKALSKCGHKMDTKLSKGNMADVHLDIKYATFTELDKYPASMSGMVKTIENFLDQCDHWTERSKQDQECEVQTCVMRCHPGVVRKQNSKDFASSSGSKQTDPTPPLRKTHEAATDLSFDSDSDSIVVLEPAGTPYFYNMRTTLRPLKKDNHDAGDFSSLSPNVAQAANFYCDLLYKQLLNCKEAMLLMEDFLSRKLYPLEKHYYEVESELKSIQEFEHRVVQTVQDLDFVCVPIDDVIDENPLKKAKDFITNATSKLPAGGDIDLLMIGKTGHGKSSTGNSILGRNQFKCSPDGESITNESGDALAKIDERVIRVVDTPGMCDTKLTGVAAFTDHGIKSLSQAITVCSTGFHALLLIFRFGIRMTEDERNGIKLLKHVLGEDMVKSYCICVLTHGDNFETEMVGKETTFEEWCKAQKGYLKELFEECGYRCVLFNNKATDPKMKKVQLIKLVSKVDSLKDGDKRYTNSIFEFAQRERQRIIAKENAHLVNEEIMKPLQLLLQSLNNIISIKKEDAVYNHELSELKKTADKLKSKIAAIKNGQSSDLFASISSLSENIDAKIDEIAKSNSKLLNEKQTDGAPKKEENSVKMDDLKPHVAIIEKQSDKLKTQNTLISQSASPAVESKIREKPCFPGSSVVMLADRKYVALKNLCVGNKVLVRDKTGCLSFDTVYMFGHHELEASSEFLALKTASQTVYVTAGHYVYCLKNGTELCVSAENVHVGDCLLVATEDVIVPQQVQTVSYERKRGLFAPFTNSGNIVIDGALMSCYIDVLPATTCHTLLWPVRQLYRVSPRLLSYINGQSSQHPIPRWAKIALKLMRESQMLNVRQFDTFIE